MYTPDLDTFCGLAQQGNLIPVYREILADLDTPVSAFLKVRGNGPAFLLESVEGGERWARYSFLGSRPSLVLTSRGGEVSVTQEGRTRTETLKGDPLDAVKAVLAPYRAVEVPGLPRFFGGLVGYLGYDLVRFFEPVGEGGKPGLDLADLWLMLTDTLVVFDNVAHTMKVVCNAHVGEGDPREAYGEATAKIELLIQQLRGAIPASQDPPDAATAMVDQAASNMSRDAFEAAVVKAKEYIAAGDIFQVVLSQRFERRVQVPPLDIYRALRVINPSPYMYYLDCGETTLVGSSPEILVRLEGERVEVRPIAGTRRRGRDAAEDARLEQELLADEKERAEHLMLLDLGRNDAGRVSQMGSVEVTEQMGVERYSHVMHLVSHVQGRLAQGRDMYDVLRACFPAGTVSGAPKVRAMQIIEEMEPLRRGPYAGAVGYFSFSGNLDTCITIRTLVLQKGMAYVQAGAGIVADSDPAREYEETVNKAMALMAAIDRAEAWQKS